MLLQMLPSEKPPTEEKLKSELKLGATLANRIKQSGGNITQKLLAQYLDVSPSTVGRWVSGETIPDTLMLLRIVHALRMSGVDELIYGSEIRQSMPEFDPWHEKIDSSVSRLQAESEKHHAAMGRIAIELLAQISESARDLINEGTVLPAYLTEDESIALERCSLDTAIVTRNLYKEIRTSSDGRTTPGTFLMATAENLKAGRNYKHLVLPDPGQNWDLVVSEFKKLLLDQGLNLNCLANCPFRLSRIQMFVGIVFLRLDLGQIRSNKKMSILHERIGNYVSPSGELAYVIPPSESLQGGVLMDIDHLNPAKIIFQDLWDKKSDPIPAVDGPRRQYRAKM